LLHEVFLRQESQCRVLDEMCHLQLEKADLHDSLDDAWSNDFTIREALTTLKAEC